jgi:ABC-type uncharacterized transport system auxiliary subunit
MIRTSTPKCFFRLLPLFLLAATAFLCGCESTTTVRDGFGMSFTENNSDTQSDNYGVDIKDTK